MTEFYHPILFFFVDGVGLAEASSRNPFSSVETPSIERLLGGGLTIESCSVSDDLVLTALDATLGVGGLPQSATGQASLFSGRNGAEVLGRHKTGLPGPQMRQMVEAGNLLRRARAAGRTVTFANAYSRAYLDDLAAGRRQASVTTTIARSAGIEWRTIADLESGAAVTWDFCRDLAGERAGLDLAPIEARTAGGHLAAISRSHDLTLFETFITDLAGHLKRGVLPQEAVARLDQAIGGLEEARDPELTWIMTSDHGNLEDISVRTHTLNPVPLLAVGPAAARFAGLTSILDVMPAVLGALGIDDAKRAPATAPV